MKNILKFIKKSIIGKILYFIRDFYRFPQMFFLVNKIKKNSNIVILVGTSTFNNLGDHLISLSSIEFINNIYKNKKVIEIPTQFFTKNQIKLKNIINSNVPIFIVGGGWMGNIWPDDEYRMQEMIKTFSNNEIFILPQTVYYDFNLKNAKKVLSDAISTYKNCKKITMFFRDQNSYNFAIENFNFINVDIFLSPDIGLYYKTLFKEKKEDNIMLCMRNDREQNKKNNIIEYIKYISKENNYKLKKTDTVVKFSIPIWLRKTKVNKKIKQMSKSSLIITDRLHGMIFSVLSNTKCIAFDNRTHKVFGVYNLWLYKNKNIIFMDNNITKEKFEETIKKLLNDNQFDDWKIYLDEKFKQMQKTIMVE